MTNILLDTSRGNRSRLSRRLPKSGDHRVKLVGERMQPHDVRMKPVGVSRVAFDVVATLAQFGVLGFQRSVFFEQGLSLG